MKVLVLMVLLAGVVYASEIRQVEFFSPNGTVKQVPPGNSAFQGNPPLCRYGRKSDFAQQGKIFFLTGFLNSHNIAIKQKSLINSTKGAQWYASR
jgi:hypothetical protein